MVFKFKYRKTENLFKKTIIYSIVLILVCILFLFLAKLYLPIELIKSNDFHFFLDTYGYFGLFLITFLGGTVIPLGSPVAVATAALLGMSKFLIILISSFGYTLGTLVNYYLAHKFGISYIKKKISEDVYEEIVNWWNRWGILLVILFALFPILPFELIALLCGLFRFNLPLFIVINFGSNLINSYVFVYIGVQASFWLGLL